MDLLDDSNKHNDNNNNNKNRSNFYNNNNINLINISKKKKIDEIFFKHVNILVREARLYSLEVTCYATSIWDESLFYAWSKIVCSMLGNENILKHELSKLCVLCNSDEITLFEGATLLFVANATKKDLTKDDYRFERIANIIKGFKLKCSRSKSLLLQTIISNDNFNAYIGPFTKTTWILIIKSYKNIEMDAIMININKSKPIFEKLLTATVNNKTNIIFQI